MRIKGERGEAYTEKIQPHKTNGDHSSFVGKAKDHRPRPETQGIKSISPKKNSKTQAWERSCSFMAVPTFYLHRFPPPKLVVGFLPPQLSTCSPIATILFFISLSPQ